MHDQFPPGTWHYQEAKAKLSRVMDETRRTGMQVIVRNKKETFIVLTKEKYDEHVKPLRSLVEFFLDAPCADIDIKRSKGLPRRPYS